MSGLMISFVSFASPLSRLRRLRPALSLLITSRRLLATTISARVNNLLLVGRILLLPNGRCICIGAIVLTQKSREASTLDGLYVERRILTGTTLSRDIAHHLYTRQLPGRVVVVNARPAVMVASIRKQWEAVIRLVQRQRASTLNAARAQELDNALEHMRSARFMTVDGPMLSGTCVVFMTQEACLAQPPECHTMYITEPDMAPIADMTAAMRPHSLAVLYELS
jgi:hypothetical protein